MSDKKYFKLMLSVKKLQKRVEKLEAGEGAKPVNDRRPIFNKCIKIFDEHMPNSGDKQTACEMKEIFAEAGIGMQTVRKAQRGRIETCIMESTWYWVRL